MFIWLMGISVSLFHQPTPMDFDTALSIEKNPPDGSTLLDLDGPMESYLREQVALEAGGPGIHPQWAPPYDFRKTRIGIPIPADHPKTRRFL